MPCVRVPRHITRHVAWLVIDYFTYAARLGSLARRMASCRFLRLGRASGCLGTSCGSSSTTSPRVGSSSTTSPTPHIRVPRHVARLISHVSSSTTSPTSCVRVPRHVARLVVDYFSHVACPGASASRAAQRRLLRLARLVVDYFAYTVRTGASARHVAPCQLLLPCRTSECLGTSRGSSSTTSPRTARHRLLHLCRAYGCLGTSRGSSFTSLPTRVSGCLSSQHVTWHVARLVVGDFAYAARPSASARRAACRRLLRPRHAYASARHVARR
jgi:hypothetical protein